MSPSLDVLLPHYRRELDEAVGRLSSAEAPPCPPGEVLLWAEVGEASGWLAPDRAMELRRLVARVRFYEGRAGVGGAGR